MRQFFVCLCFTFLLGPAVAEQLGPPACGLWPEHHYGPWDYTNPVHYRDKLPVVERAHFNRDVENLRAGMTGHLTGDLAYTLNAFPNHHRALHAMSRYQLANPTEKRKKKVAGIECYFQRAMYFKPDDSIVRMLHGIHLQKSGKLNQAVAAYNKSLEIAPGSPEVHYNLGLLYVEQKNYEKARENALKAYAGGYPLPGLRRKLQSVGAWSVEEVADNQSGN